MSFGIESVVYTNIPEMKLVRTMWLFGQKIRNISSGILNIARNLVISRRCHDDNDKEIHIPRCKMHVQGVRNNFLLLTKRIFFVAFS